MITPGTANRCATPARNRKVKPMELNTIRTRLDLINALNHGAQPDYLFFWGHRPQKDQTVGKSCFSQWYAGVPFEIDGIVYPTAEHWMMAQKARLFDDQQTYTEILTAPTPGEAKKLGRKISPFDEATWLAERFALVVQGNLAKFSQHPTLQHFLLGTGSRVLVEASPADRIWGIGLAQDHPDAGNPYKWQGLNLLGFALMEVRSQLQADL